jgi:hypothetical protein
MGVVTSTSGVFRVEPAVPPQIGSRDAHELAGLALVITIPLSIAAGVYAARRRDRKVDRAIVPIGVTSSSIPSITATIRSWSSVSS